MKYDKLTIVGLPKKFKVYNVVDYLYPDDGQPESPDDVIYDFLPEECEVGNRSGNSIRGGCARADIFVIALGIRC